MLDGRGLAAEQRAAAVGEVATLTDIAPLLDAHPFDLSGGEVQRAALAKVLLCEPRLLLLDEPTKGLDAFFKDKLARLLRSLTARGTTVLMVSHDVEFCASYADWCCPVLRRKRGDDQSAPAVLRFEQLLYHSSQSHKPGLLRKCGYRGGGGGAMPKLTEGARSAEAFRERRRARVKTILTILAALVLAPLTAVAGMAVPGNGYYLSGHAHRAVRYRALLRLLRRATSHGARNCRGGRADGARRGGRAAFIWVPHFKPMAAVIMIAGLAAGPQTGFLVGSVAALASNFIFGQGPWTPWQMLAFGVAGLVAGLLADARVFPRANLSWPRRIALATVGFVLIVGLVGPILDTSTFFYLSTAPTPELAAVVYLAGLPVNAIHGAATALTLLVVANPLLDQLARVRVKYGLLDRSRPNCP